MDCLRWDLEIDRRDHLVFGGYDLVELARTYGTPVHVVDEARLRRNVAAVRRAFEERYADVGIFYSYKTNCVPGVLSIVHEAGCGAEVASPYEYRLASELGVAPASTIYNGVNRSVDDFERAIRAGVHLINVDSMSEAQRLIEAASRSTTTARVGIRIDPGVGWRAHFGVGARTGELLDLVRRLTRSPNVKVCGVHAHVGSCLTDATTYARAIERVAGAIAAMPRSTPIAVDAFDIGGGFGVPTVKRFRATDAAMYRLFNRAPKPPAPDACATLDQFAEQIVTALAGACARHRLDAPRLILEPGRAITGSAQVLLVTVQDIKTLARGARVALADGGMQNVAFPLSYEYHHCFVANRARESVTEPWFVAGPLCSAEDLLYRNWPLPRLARGDVLAIMDAGAYFTSFANSFSFPRPPVILVSNGTSRVLKARETFQEMA